MEGAIMMGYGVRDEDLWICLKVFLRIEVVPKEDMLGRGKYVGI